MTDARTPLFVLKCSSSESPHMEASDPAAYLRSIKLLEKNGPLARERRAQDYWDNQLLAFYREHDHLGLSRQIYKTSTLHCRHVRRVLWKRSTRKRPRRLTHMRRVRLY